MALVEITRYTGNASLNQGGVHRVTRRKSHLVALFRPLRVWLRTFLALQGPDSLRSRKKTTEIQRCVVGAALGHGKAGKTGMSVAVVAGKSRRAQVNEAGEEVAPPLVCRRR